MYGHGFFLKLNFNHFERFSTLNSNFIGMLMITFNIEKCSTTFEYRKEIFTNIQLFPFNIFIPNKKPLLTALTECFLKEN